MRSRGYAAADGVGSRQCTERSVYALSCVAVSLVEFTVNHIAFIARFSRYPLWAPFTRSLSPLGC